MKGNLKAGLGKYGYSARVVSVERLQSLKESVEADHSNGLLNEEFYQRYLARFAPAGTEDMPSAKSLIVVAARQPRTRFIFSYRGSKTVAIVPPSYLHAEEADAKVQERLASLLSPEGFCVAPALVPRKLLAVRSGLAVYGRNNITYVEGMGSFHRLSAFLSDMPPEAGEEWYDLKIMERCGDCDICARKCPTGAIGPDRVLLHAERCIVYHNEKPYDIPFPGWMEGSWHNCLVGCMLCQRLCPENKKYLGEAEAGAEFSDDETALLLAGLPHDQLPAALVKKLKESDLYSITEVIPRNLNILLQGAAKSR